MWLPLAGYALLLGVLALTHDMWRDEVRAFSVATQAESWGGMFADLGEEGHPAVWYIILRAGYAVTHSALVLPVAAALVGLATAWLILRFAPFPLWLRLLSVFGVFLAHELSVVARNYGIGVLCMIGACIMFRQRHERPFPLALTLAVLANTSVHGAVAAALLLLLWMMDVLDADRRRLIRALPFAAGVALVMVGIVVALATARPPDEMAYAFRFSSLEPSAIAGAILIDPGAGLRGSNGANLVASGEIPWSRIGLHAEVIGRILVNVALASALWAFRRNRRVLVVLVLAIPGFEILFRVVYTGALRHEALLAFLIFSLAWIAVDDSPDAARPGSSRRIAFGLLPLFVLQAAALPFTAWRQVTKPESMGHELARVIGRVPAYRDAILMSEPEPLMETMPYYVRNPVFMPRQREYDYRAYFDSGARRQIAMSLTDLVAVADSVACAERNPVLLSIGHRRFLLEEQGEAVGPYGSLFRWTAEEKSRFIGRVKPLDWFPGSTSDENFRTYEVGCM